MTIPVVHYTHPDSCEAVCGRHNDPAIHFTSSHVVDTVTCPACLHTLALDTAHILAQPISEGYTWRDANDGYWYTVRHGQVVPSSAYSQNPTR